MFVVGRGASGKVTGEAQEGERNKDQGERKEERNRQINENINK